MKYYKILILISLTACSPTKEERAEALYTTHCASCHLLPSPQDLPKHLWKGSVLPEMAARMGIKDSTYNPYAGFSFSEQEKMMLTGIYTKQPSMSTAEWVLLKDYIIKSAPEKLDMIPEKVLSMKLSQFITKPINLDSINGTSITFLDFDNKKGSVITGDLAGNIMEYNTRKNNLARKENFEEAITAYTEKDSTEYITFIGTLNPSEIAKGKIYKIKGESIEQIASDLHRPVYTSVHDFDNDGHDELLVSEFGNLTGLLSLWHKTESSSIYQKEVLLGLPGVIRTIVKDMNHDGKPDIVALSTQGNEGINILYQTNDLMFRTEQAIRFNPVYGSSWFEMLDYDGDGDNDIITAHGDNADETYVHKPYHGIRIHLNDGNNNFEEKFFYPLNGATRFVANDFDKDGDVDIAVVSSFPDYDNAPELSFVYLENQDAKNFKFLSFGLKDSSLGRWLLIDTADFDDDGDFDIVLSSFSYYFTPVPEELNKNWKASDVDLLLLENTLY